MHADIQSHINEKIVYELFRLTLIDTLLDPFADDAIVYEPFSNTRTNNIKLSYKNQDTKTTTPMIE